MTLDPLILSRLQFAFTVSFHIIFPAFTIGLASWLAVLEGMWLKTNRAIYKEIYKLWVKVFAVAFGMGVVSGIVLSYQFGTNWAGFSLKLANVLGPLLTFEVLTAFFLEASFLGIMLFGWGRVTPRMHFAATIIVAVGTLISAFWIIAANSWMHTPAGFIIKDGIFYPTNWWQIIFNPSFPYRFIHMITATYLTTAFAVGGAGCWYLLKNKSTDHAKVMVRMAMFLVVILAPLQIILGDLHGLQTLKHQPAKIAAMEGAWDTEKGAPLRLFTIIDEAAEKNLFSLEIPKIGSLILTHDWQGEVKGLKDWPREQRPPVKIVFWCFRVMVGIGFLMALTAATFLILWLRRKIWSARWFHYWCVLMAPAGFIAILAGWFVTEIGRQPYVVYGLVKTSDIVSKIAGGPVLGSLILFVLTYCFVFGMGIYYIFKLLRRGPLVWSLGGAQSLETFGNHSLQQTITTKVTVDREPYE